MKHAAGPWKLTTLKGSRGHLIKSKSGCLIASVEQYPESAPLAPECLPNAQLIQQAPRLLESLVKMVSSYRELLKEETGKDPSCPEYLEAIYLIQKARGAN